MFTMINFLMGHVLHNGWTFLLPVYAAFQIFGKIDHYL